MASLLISRIEARLEELGISPQAASLRVGTNRDLFRGILRAGDEANPTAETMAKVAEALQVSEAWLRGDADGKPPHALGRFDTVRSPSPASASESMPKDLPVWGTAAGSIIEDKIEGFHLFSGEPIDMVRRPPALASVRDAYAIYVTGDSMEPMHNPGDLRFVHPRRPPAPGDTVVVQTQHWEEDPGQGYIKIYRRRKGSAILLEQFNPRANIELPLQYVSSVHRVMTMNELFGV